MPVAISKLRAAHPRNKIASLGAGGCRSPRDTSPTYVMRIGVSSCGDSSWRPSLAMRSATSATTGCSASSRGMAGTASNIRVIVSAPVEVEWRKQVRCSLR